MKTHLSGKDHCMKSKEYKRIIQHSCLGISCSTVTIHTKSYLVIHESITHTLVLYSTIQLARHLVGHLISHECDKCFSHADESSQRIISVIHLLLFHQIFHLAHDKFSKREGKQSCKKLTQINYTK